jgi:hypothetical protein
LRGQVEFEGAAILGSREDHNVLLSTLVVGNEVSPSLQLQDVVPWVVFESPVYWTEKRLWTELNQTDHNWTIGCSCPNILTSLVHGSSMVEHLNRPPKDQPQPVEDQTFSCINLTRFENIIHYVYCILN